MTDATRHDGTLLGRVERAAETVAAYLTLLASALVFGGVVLRNLFTVSPSWIAEVPSHAFVWAVFLALAGAFSRGPQLGLDIVVRQLPRGVQRALSIFGSLAMLAIACMIVWLGFELALRQFTTGAASNTATRTPLWLITLALPIGFALLGAHALARIAGREPQAARPAAEDAP